MTFKAEQENKSSTPSDDMGLPEGFDMSALDGLDDLLKEAGTLIVLVFKSTFFPIFTTF